MGKKGAQGMIYIQDSITKKYHHILLSHHFGGRSYCSKSLSSDIMILVLGFCKKG